MTPRILIPIAFVSGMLGGAIVPCGIATMQAISMANWLDRDPIYRDAYASAPLPRSCHLNGIAIECDDLNEYEADSPLQPIRKSQVGREI